ncbi:hypothetical protein [Streptosporangium sp. NPDC000396]|uniref:hypothetical protein n=1 Tax=Streptosporangium sp. NPDC000396 TaxID=3366185 RepID=UPI00367CF37F
MRDQVNDEKSDEHALRRAGQMPKAIFKQLAELFGAYDELHLGDDAHALDGDEEIDEKEDIDDEF